MPKQLSAPQQARQRLGGAVKKRDHEAIAAARADLRMAVAEDYIRKLAGSVPPLSGDQRARLAALLLDLDGSRPPGSGQDGS